MIDNRNRMVSTNQPSGWECPKCGKANAPSVSVCNHMPVVCLNGGIAFLGGADKPLESGHMEIHSSEENADA